MNSWPRLLAKGGVLHPVDAQINRIIAKVRARVGGEVGVAGGAVSGVEPVRATPIREAPLRPASRPQIMPPRGCRM